MCLYESDETAWLDEQVLLLKQQQHDRLDYENLREFLESMSRSEKKEVKSRLIILISHILKWKYQPEGRCPSWHATILVQQDALEDDVTAGSLRHHALGVLPDAYEKGRRLAAIETGLPPDRFPVQCEWTLDGLLAFVPSD